MSEPYVGEIRMFGGNFAPQGWHFCEGQLLQISNPENETLFFLIGTTYGGDGVETFALPDLRGRIPIHRDEAFALADQGGAEAVGLVFSHLPRHRHVPQASSLAATSTQPEDMLPSKAARRIYAETATLESMALGTVGYAGDRAAHENMQPYLCLNFIISLYGLYPTPS